MNIGIDFHAAHGMCQGNQTYIRNLVSNLLCLDKINEYFLYTYKEAERHPFIGDNIRCRNVLSSNPFCRLGIELPRHIICDKLDIFHSIFINPYRKRCRYVVTVHDILFEHYPQFFNRMFVLRSKLFVRKSVRNADKIITISSYSRDAIASTYDIERSKIVVSPLGVDETFHPDPNVVRRSEVYRKYGIKHPFLLFVGRLEPRKNIPTLLKAFSLLFNKGFRELYLVIGGERDFGYQSIYRMVSSLNIDKNVIFTGKIKQDDLPVVMSGARLFVYPSFCEGFGLPVLEAMACGVPVVTSNVSSLFEIVGDSAVLVNPYSVDSIVYGIHKILTNASLSKDLIQRGLQRARLYSWKACAQKTLQVYASLSR